MFRSLSRLQGLASKSRFDHYLLTLSRSSDSTINAIKRRDVSSNRRPSKLKSADRPDQVASRSNDDSVVPKNRSANANESVESFLETIDSKIPELSRDELEAAHKKIFDLFHKSTGPTGPKRHHRARGLVESPVYEQLLAETVKRMRQFSVSNLVIVFQSVASFEYDKKQDPVIKETMRVLKSKLKELDLEQLFVCLNAANYNMRDLKLLRGSKSGLVNMFKFSQDVLKETKRRILNRPLSDAEQIEQILKHFHVFLRLLQFDEEIIVHLAEFLCQSPVQLNYQKSVVLLGKIQKSYVMYVQMREKAAISDLMQNKEFVATRNERRAKWSAFEFLPRQVIGLIDECNRIICKSFRSHSSDRDLFFYLTLMHNVINPCNFELPNIYDQKILNDFLAPSLLQRLDAGRNDQKTNLLLLNLAYNYFMYQRCNERLLQLIYDLISRQPADWSRLPGIVHLFFVFTKFRLPFVNANRLAECILNPSDKGFQNEIGVKVVSLSLLTSLVLNDVNNEKLYDYLDKKIEKLSSQRFYESVRKGLFAKLTLARVYLSLSDGLRDSVKHRIEERLDEIIKNVKAVTNRQTLDSTFLQLNNTLQANGYLSNGLLLDAFVIYDKSTQKLVPLDGHDFNRVDEIPLTSDQEL